MKIEQNEALRIGVIGAMESEVGTIKENLSDCRVSEWAGMEFFAGTVGRTPAVVVRCGVGKVNAALCAQILIDRFGVTHILNTGVAGSLDDRIAIGDLVISADLVQHDYDVTPLGFAPGEIMGLGVRFFEADPALRSLARAAAREAAPEIGLFEGRICSGDQFIAGSARKRALREAFGGLCAEMEGAAIAQACWRSRVPFVVLRAISDKADESTAVSYSEFEKEAARHCAGIVLRMLERIPG